MLSLYTMQGVGMKSLGIVLVVMMAVSGAAVAKDYIGSATVQENFNDPTNWQDGRIPAWTNDDDNFKSNANLLIDGYTPMMKGHKFETFSGTPGDTWICEPANAGSFALRKFALKAIDDGAGGHDALANFIGVGAGTDGVYPALALAEIGSAHDKWPPGSTLTMNSDSPKLYRRRYNGSGDLSSFQSTNIDLDKNKVGGIRVMINPDMIKHANDEKEMAFNMERIRDYDKQDRLLAAGLQDRSVLGGSFTILGDRINGDHARKVKIENWEAINPGTLDSELNVVSPDEIGAVHIQRELEFIRNSMMMIDLLDSSCGVYDVTNEDGRGKFCFGENDRWIDVKIAFSGAATQEQYVFAYYDEFDVYDNPFREENRMDPDDGRDFIILLLER